MRKNSRAKGAVGERELANELTRCLGVEARRGQQFSGSPDSPDIVHSVPGVHIECKRTEKLSLYAAMAQAKYDAGDKVPTVMHRRNREEWLVVVPLERLLELAERLREAT